VYEFLAPRACTAILLGSLLCNLGAKLYYAARYDLMHEYHHWVLTDIGVLVILEAVLVGACYLWPRRRVVRSALIVAALVCTWSVMNAGWLVRTGTQILPMDVHPLVRDPLNIGWLVVVSLVRMPGVAAALLLPSAVALMLFFPILARAPRPAHHAGRFRLRIAGSLMIGLVALGGDAAVSNLGSTPVAAAGLRWNCQARAILAFVLPQYRHVARSDFKNATRRLPRAGEVKAQLARPRINHNIVVVVLEGVQYDCTSLAAEQGGIAPQGAGRPGGPTPYLSTLAAQGVSFTSARSVVTHTTKALFALLTGRVPSASQDIAETVPVDQPYASLATILRQTLGFRTAFFQSAKGSFESRPGLVHNLGFDDFWSRENLNDPNQHVGYLGSDEFALLDPIRAWIESDRRPFLLVVLCSVTHDPYEVPSWYGPQGREPTERYLQTVAYTDRFLAALDVQLADLGLGQDTILCVVGDHGEGFGEHRIHGHERLAFEEVLRIALCLRAPHLIDAGRRITAPVSSLDVTPMLLGLLGFDAGAMGFDGVDALRPLPADRRVYFSGWMHQGPAGFVQGDRKYVYDPERETVTMYGLKSDPLEHEGTGLSQQEGEKISGAIAAWRRSTIFRSEVDDDRSAELFDAWLWKPNGRVSRLKEADEREPKRQEAKAD
jgi:arylsulfatase A-like enzyme